MNVEVLGRDDFGGVLTKVGKTVQATAKTPVGKFITAAFVDSASVNLTPTQKAALAQAQIAAGMVPQVIVPTSGTQIAVPTDFKTTMQKNMPLIIIGGAALVGLLIVMATMKK